MADIPKIRFKGFTEPWEQRKLSDIAVLTSSKRVHAEDYVETGVPFYRGKEISELKEHKPISEVLYITEYKYNEISSMYGSPKEGDLLITAVGTLGNTWVIDQTPFYFKDGNLIWFKDIKCNPKYLDYAMSTADGQKKILASAIGSNQKALTMVKLNELEFMFPGKAEQDKIAEYFSYLDNLITLHQRKCDDTKELKKYMLQKMFPKNGEKFPEIRFKGFTEAWEQRKVSEYANFFTGNGLNWNDISDDGEQECILYGNLYTDYGMITENIVYRTNTEIKNPVYSEYGDVLIPASDTTPTGLARATSLEKSGVLLGGDINIIRPNEGINGSCLSLALNANRKELIRLIKGTTVRHIHNSEIKDIVICLPKLETEQVRVSSYFKQLDHLITLHRRAL